MSGIYSRLSTIRLLLRRKTLLVTLRIEVADRVAKTIAPMFAKNREKLYLTHNAGFFSCLSVALNSVVENPPLSISARFGMRLYKAHLFTDPWKYYFKPPQLHNQENQFSPPPSIRLIPAKDWWWRRYEALPIIDVSLYIEMYFAPSDRVRAKMIESKNTYNLEPSKTIGVHYRGTDKLTEFSITGIEEYIRNVSEIISQVPNHKILLQTDDYVAYQKFFAIYGERMITFDQPTSPTSGIGLHYLGNRNPVEDTVKYFSTTLILSQCDYLITHTGNGALWEILYRGNNVKVIQL